MHYKKASHLLCPLPSFHRADGETETSRPGDVRNVHVISQPLVPPGESPHNQCLICIIFYFKMSNIFGKICIILGVGQHPAITGRLRGKRDECH